MSAAQAIKPTNWSPLQAALFDWTENGTGNACVIAVAGSGKTTTGVEMTKRAKGSHIFLAFNKAIATELSSRGVNGRTFHSLCYSPVLKFKGAATVESNKLRKLLEANFAQVEIKAYGQFMQKMVGLARNAGIDAGLLPNVASEWEALADHHDLEPDSDQGTTMAHGIELARQLLAMSNASDLVDFDDLLYVAVKEGIALPRFDFVFVDEGQDTNAIQRAIIRKIMHSNSRLAVVGDPHQAIYGFRGADSNSMDLIKQEFGCVDLPLTVTYRCPVAVVEHAKQWVDHIEAAPGAADGTVNEIGQDWDFRNFATGDLVVCRTTKPLVSLAYTLIRNRVAAHITGREIGQGLVSLVNKMQAKGLESLLAKLDAYGTRESEKAKAKGNDSKAEAILDKVDCVRVIAEGLHENDRTVPGLVFAIQNLFSDQAGGVKLATIHKAKGLEADRVFWMTPAKCRTPRQEWQKEQERNLCYVATTRAKCTLVLMDEKRD
jgi:DNA helicase-2/ATP-dependent DNA helicase PcrA